MSAAILMLQKDDHDGGGEKKEEEKKKEKETQQLHQTLLTNAPANINALLIHPICRLIAFLYTVMWHLLLGSGAREQPGGGVWEGACQRRCRLFVNSSDQGRTRHRCSLILN